MINLMAAASKHNVETEWHTQKTLPGKNNNKLLYRFKINDKNIQFRHRLCVV